MPSKWQLMTKSEKLELVSKLINDGYSYAAVAEDFGEGASVISSFCRYHGIKSSFNQGGQPNNNNAMVDRTGRSTIKRLTKKILIKAQRNLFKCERCDFIDVNELPRHHKDRNRNNNDISNLEVLCRSCHALEHTSERNRDIEGRYA